jgi:cell division protein FtsW
MSGSLDRTLLFSWLVIVGFGVVMVASASVAQGDGLLVRHVVFLALGAVAFLGALLMPLDWWRQGHQMALLLALVLCAVVLIPGIGVQVNGARRWIGLGLFSIQAGEFAKLLLLVYLAGYLARFRDDIHKGLWAAIRPLAMLTLVCACLLFQPDYGTLVVLMSVSLALVFLAGARLRHFLALLVLGCAAVALLAVGEPYRMKRLISFTDPWQYAFSSGYQLTQALIAFGRGEIFGLGLGEGIQKLDYLPEAHNDFIFAVIAEELGVVGALFLILLFGLMVIRIFRLGRNALLEGNYFGGFLAYGVGLILGIQFLVNIGVNTGSLPTKGLTLPFVSFGGNSIIVSCAMIGLVLRLQLERSVHD